MTKPQFIRWANRREKAADALREARRHMAEMNQISGAGAIRGLVDDAWLSTGRAISELARALQYAARPPQDEQGE